jgi:hypothetical protein
LVVPPGFRLYVQARLVCTVQVTGADGEPASQSTQASANSDPVSVAPQLLGFVVMASRVCGRPDISAARMRRVPQARSHGYVSPTYFASPPRTPVRCSARGSRAAARLQELRCPARGGRTGDWPG